jgi:hypothetical protein
MAIERWDPFHELNTLQQCMKRLFQESFPDSSGFRGEESLTGEAFPPVDVYEDEHNVVLKIGYSGEGERLFRREAERHSGVKVNSSRSEATLAW